MQTFALRLNDLIARFLHTSFAAPGRLGRTLALVATASALSIMTACGGGSSESELTAADGQKRGLAVPGTPQSAARQLFGATAFQDRLDLNGDGKSDLIWYDSTAGTSVAWLMDGQTLQGGGGLLTHPTYRVVGSGDFDGDGKSDLVWHDSIGDATTIWLMDGAVAAQGRNILAGQSYTPIGAPDLDGDGKSDLLWFNPVTGSTVAWLMNGSTVKASATLLTHPSFQVVALPDLDGDGKTDLIWHDRESGQTVAWMMNGLAYKSGLTLLTHPRFKVSVVSDLNGDGKSDLIWRDSTFGNTVAWLMDGLSLVGGRQLLQDALYEVVAAPDLDGDGKADLLWHNATAGETIAWLMDGTTLKGGGTLLRDGAYRPIGTSDFNGDGRADLSWYNEAARSSHAWISSSFAFAGVDLLTMSPYVTAALFHSQVVQSSAPYEVSRTLFAHFHFAGTETTSTPYSVARTQELIEGGLEPMPSHFRLVSRGRMNMVPTYAEFLPLTKTEAAFQAEDELGGTLIQDALAVLERNGKLVGVDAVVLFLPQLQYGQPGAAANIGKIDRTINGKPYRFRTAWLIASAYDRGIIMHELGHTFGMEHSSAVSPHSSCTPPSISLLDARYCAGITDESFTYFVTGDFVDYMGGLRGYPNIIQSMRAGWINLSQVLTPMTSATHQITAIDAMDTSVVGLKVALDSGVAERGIHYFVEYRTRPIVDLQTGQTLRQTNNVQVRLSDKRFVDEYGQLNQDISYVWRNPATGDVVAMNAVGESYWDRYRGIRFTWVGTAGTSATPKADVKVEISTLRLSARKRDGVSTIAFTNRGTTAVRLNGGRLAGRNMAQFAIVADGCSGVEVAPGGQCNVAVSYPADVNLHGSLLMDTTDPLRPVAEYSVQ